MEHSHFAVDVVVDVVVVVVVVVVVAVFLEVFNGRRKCGRDAIRNQRVKLTVTQEL